MSPAVDPLQLISHVTFCPGISDTTRTEWPHTHPWRKVNRFIDLTTCHSPLTALFVGSFVYRIETRRARRDEKQRQRVLREPSSRGLSLTPSPVHRKIEWDEEEPIHTVANRNRSDMSHSRQDNTFVQPVLPGYAAMNPFMGLPPPHGHPSFLPLSFSGALTDHHMLGMQANFAHLAAGMITSQGLTVSPAVDKGGKRVSAGQPTPSSEGKPEFKCRVCGRVFAKVKSRSAHMKIHSSRSDQY